MGKIRNWARWSEMLVIIFPAIRLSDGSVEKILSINVFDLGLIHVGKVIWDMKKLENIYIYIYIKSLRNLLSHYFYHFLTNQY